MTEYDLLRPWLSLDPWQKEYIETEGNCFLLCGRQSGKSTAASIKFGKRAATKPNRIILMIAFTENQAYQLFFKTLMYLEACYPQMIARGLKKPTKHVINLKNGSKIMCHAAGLAGEGIRGFTLTDLVIDEAAAMAKEVFTATSPMLSVTGGNIDLLSTPRGKEGFFYECSLREDFKKFYISAEDCPRHNKAFLEAEKGRMSRLEYSQEYLAVFLDDLKRVFSDRWIERICVAKRPGNIAHEFKHYLGCDIARLGNDESTFEIIKKIDRDKYIQVENIVTKKQLTTDTIRKIIELEDIYHFKNIGIDAGAGSLGVGVFDFLVEETKTKRKVVAINNRERILDKDGEKKAKILKEDLYNNLVALGDWGKIKLLDDDEIKASLASIQYEYVIKANRASVLRIFGNYSHIVEGIIRAAWLASKDKTLNIWAA